MKKYLVGLVVFLAAFSLCASGAMAINVAYNATVVLDGTFFTGGWGSGTTVEGETIVNGVFLPENTQWDQGPVWWDAHTVSDQTITLNLDGLYDIDSFIVQADNNDTYRLEYLNNGSMEWIDIPSLSGYGMMTRPEVFLTDTITTSALKFTATGGDDYYAVSEIQAFGQASAIPEPSTLLLLGAGLLFLSRKVNKKT